MARHIRPDELFALDAFAHRRLFDQATDAWEVLGPPLATYLEGQRFEIRGEVHPGAYLVGDDIFIGEGTVVEPGAYIAGPTVIGRDCQVRHGAFIRGKTLVGDGCVVGHATEVKGSILLDGAKASHFAYVGDSILGNGVNLGAGTKLANFKLTADAVILKIDGERVDSGRRKLGALLGDRCQTGCNSVTSPGTIFGPDSFVYPCVSVRAGVYEPGTWIKK